ncbi:hypothetical protein HYV31_01680 [candidate division WWE3 bacterium]|nr:hypothetical protein [candidate division WWE3 bacterium]
MVKRASKSKLFHIFILASSVCIGTLFGISVYNIESQVYQAVAQSQPIVVFPQDHVAHPNFAAEWWYLNLITRSTKTDGTSEKDLGYIISFSRVKGVKGLLSSRYDNTSKTFKEKTNVGDNLSVTLINSKYLLVKYSNGATSMTLEEKPIGFDRKRLYKLTGKTPEIGSFDLTLKERTVPLFGNTSPLLWGGSTGNCSGKISVFGLNDTFYYSIPDLDISGIIIDIDGVTRNVKAGKAWIDHQWFNSTPPSDWKGHYWTSFHYTYSNSLFTQGAHQAVGFVSQIYSSGPRYTYWVKRNLSGKNECGVGGSMAVSNYGTSGYPTKWKAILNKSASIFLLGSGVSFSDTQIFKPPVGPQFYEPFASYTGTDSGKAFIGVGVFETHLKK